MSFGAPTPPAGRSGSGVDATAREAAAAAQAAADEAAGIGEAAQATADSAHSGSANDSTARAAASAAQATATSATTGSAHDSTARAAAAAAQAGSGNDSTARAAAATAQTAANKALSWRGLIVKRGADRWLPQGSEVETLHDTIVSNSTDGGLVLSSGRVVIGPGVSLVRAWTTTRLANVAEYHSSWIRHYRGAAVHLDYIGFAEGANSASMANVSHPIVVQQGDALAHFIYGQKAGGVTVPSSAFYPFVVEVLE